jgi:prepilin-type processing-associated H-X9-DG protein
MSFINAIGTANPINKLSQRQVGDFMVKAMQLNKSDERRLRAIFNASGITSRYSVLEDYGREGDFNFFSNTNDLEPFPSTKKRIDEFKKNALQLSIEAVKNLQNQFFFNPSSITHLITVCCTGMYAPGLDLDLVRELNLPTQVQRTCVNFMGCYAAINAIRLADSICNSSPNARVLIVCTELCSLHFQKEASYDNFLANALFADGSAAMLIESNSNSSAIELEGFHCDILADGSNEMMWEIGDLGFEMKLSGYVPSLIKSGIGNFANTLLTRIGLNLSQVKYFAVHPGGKKILEAVEAEFKLTRDNLLPSYDVLTNYGNMSSPACAASICDWVIEFWLLAKLADDDHTEACEARKLAS